MFQIIRSDTMCVFIHDKSLFSLLVFNFGRAFHSLSTQVFVTRAAWLDARDLCDYKSYRPELAAAYQELWRETSYDYERTHYLFLLSEHSS